MIILGGACWSVNCSKTQFAILPDFPLLVYLIMSQQSMCLSNQKIIIIITTQQNNTNNNDNIKTLHGYSATYKHTKPRIIHAGIGMRHDYWGDRFHSTASAGRIIPFASPIDLPLPIPKTLYRLPRRGVEDGRGLRRANISRCQPKQTRH